MDVREKFVELLDIIIQPGQKTLGDIADHLITHGVTVQEWISVKDRLPEVTGKYVCCVKEKGENAWTIPVDWSLEMKMWFGEFGEIKNRVTHWMPLPQPPKGE